MFFDPSKVGDIPERKEFAPLPPGLYRVVVTGASVKQNKKENGKYAQVEFTVLDDEQKGRKIFSFMNTENPSEMAVSIGHSELKKLLSAVDSHRPLQTEHDFIQAVDGRQLVVKIGTKEDALGKLRNVVLDYRAKDSKMDPFISKAASEKIFNKVVSKTAPATMDEEEIPF